MIEKIGSVKNPLTIIAIFAGIAEVSGTTVLPFISDHNQGTFVYFLIAFPIILIILFFLTLNFNNKALYAPSDFNDEENYIKIFRYDISKQENIEITVTQDNLLKQLNQQFIELRKSSTEKILVLENELFLLKHADINNDDGSISENKLVYVSNFYDAQKFVTSVLRMGYDAEIYMEGDSNDAKIAPEKFEAIWIGSQIPLNVAKNIIQLGLKMYPFLKYIKLNPATEPDNDYIYIGGATDAAIRLKLKPLGSNQFDKIQTFETIDELHSYVKSFEQ